MLFWTETDDVAPRICWRHCSSFWVTAPNAPTGTTQSLTLLYFLMLPLTAVAICWKFHMYQNCGLYMCMHVCVFCVRLCLCYASPMISC